MTTSTEMLLIKRLAASCEWNLASGKEDKPSQYHFHNFIRNSGYQVAFEHTIIWARPNVFIIPADMQLANILACTHVFFIHF